MKKKILMMIVILITGLVRAQDPVNSPFAIQAGDYHSPEVQAMTRYGQGDRKVHHDDACRLRSRPQWKFN